MNVRYVCDFGSQKGVLNLLELELLKGMCAESGVLCRSSTRTAGLSLQPHPSYML